MQIVIKFIKDRLKIYNYCCVLFKEISCFFWIHINIFVIFVIDSTYTESRPRKKYLKISNYFILWLIGIALIITWILKERSDLLKISMVFCSIRTDNVMGPNMGA